MRFLILLLLALVAVIALVPATSDTDRQQDETFADAKPLVGDPLPDLIVYSPDGREVKTSDLRGQYVVLTFGCLT